MPQPISSPKASQPIVSRRTVFAGAGAAGAAVAAAAVLPGVVQKSAPAVVAEPKGTSGYQLTEHVRRYYQTAKV